MRNQDNDLIVNTIVANGVGLLQWGGSIAETLW